MNSLAVQEETQDLPQLFELAKHLVPTGMLPEHLKTPGQVVAIILAGRELGMPPMRSLRSLTLVKGKVVESADSQLARFKTDGGKAKFVTLTEDEAVMDLVHPNGDEHTERFSMSDAKRAGLTSNQTWAKYPKAMLRSRVITAGLKSIGWDGAVGNYDPDEAREITGGRPVAVVAAPAEPTVQMPRRKSEAKAEAAPADEVVIVAEEIPPGDPISQAEPEDDIEALLQASIDQQQAKADEPKINQKDVGHLKQLVRENGHDTEAVKRFLARRGFASSKDIPVSAFSAIRARLADPTPLEA